MDRLVAALRDADRDNREVAGWGREIAVPLVEGLVAFWRRDHPAAAEHLYPVRAIANRFGGSHAQRDIIDWTLTEAALRGGLADLAEALAHERLALKPHSPVNRGLLSRARNGCMSPRPSA